LSTSHKQHEKQRPNHNYNQAKPKPQPKQKNQLTIQPLKIWFTANIHIHNQKEKIEN
jgi:hypothetical protein